MKLRTFDAICSVLLGLAALSLLSAVVWLVVGSILGALLAAWFGLAFGMAGKLFVEWHRLYGRRD